MLYFFHTKCVSKMGRVRSPKRRVRDDDFMVGWSSNYLYIGEAIQAFSVEIFNLESRARRSIWCSAHYK